MDKGSILRAAIVWGSVVAVPASAQSPAETHPTRIEFCRSIKDDGRRLRCFDELFTETRNAIAWVVKESKSPLDDSPEVYGWLRVGEAILVLRCKEKKTEVLFSKQFVDFGRDAIKVIVRINRGTPIESSWQTSRDGSVAFAPSAVEFIRSLQDDGKLFLRAIGHAGRMEDTEFELGRVSEVREKIGSACNWPQFEQKNEFRAH